MRSMDYLKVSHDFSVINQRSQAYVTEACRPWKLSYSEHVTLMSLYSHEGCRQHELCQVMKADKALVARNLKTLEEKGFVSRRQQGTDRRYKYLYLTPKARELQDTMEAILKKWVDASMRRRWGRLCSSCIKWPTMLLKQILPPLIPKRR